MHDLSFAVLSLWCIVSLSSTSSVQALSSTIRITPPRSTKDWKQLAVLVATTSTPSNETNNWIQQWQSQHQVYQHYVRTARKLRGKKYTILLAKDHDRVVGMAELGISSSTADDDSSATDKQQRRATLGVLCVDPNSRRQGVARALVEKCEEVVQQSWQHEMLHVQVEPSNSPALLLFGAAGFTPLQNTTRGVPVRSRNNRVEIKPHRLLCKRLTTKAKRGSPTNDSAMKKGIR